MQRIFFNIPLPFTDSTVPIFSYGTMMVVACVVLMHITLRRAKAIGIDKQVVYDVTLYSLIFGVVGARLTFVIFDLPAGAPISEYFKLWNGGLTFQGGFALGLLFNVIYLTRKKLSFGKIADLFAPGVAIAVGIGRVGCFLNGCCWGKICHADFPLGVRFPIGEKSLVWLYHTANIEFFMPLARELGQDALPYLVHPAQLYTTVTLITLGLVLLLIEKPFRLIGGQLMALFIMFYSLARFIIEYWRDDTKLTEVVSFLPRMNPGQIAGAIFFFVALGLFVYLRFIAASRIDMEG